MRLRVPALRAGQIVAQFIISSILFLVVRDSTHTKISELPPLSYVQLGCVFGFTACQTCVPHPLDSRSKKKLIPNLAKARVRDLHKNLWSLCVLYKSVSFLSCLNIETLHSDDLIYETTLAG